MARAMASRLLLRPRASSVLRPSVHGNGQELGLAQMSIDGSGYDDSISAVLSSEAALPSCHSRAAVREPELAGVFLGLMRTGVVGRSRRSSSYPEGCKRSMYTDVAAARVGKRPIGVPESQVDALEGIQEMAAGAGATARMSIVLKSFEKIRPGRLNNVSKVGLPTTRILFTFNRSPHVDKKSREQFDMKTRKKLLVMDMDVGKLREKYNQLKNHNMLGVQLKVNFHYKTRLDMSRINGALAEASTVEQLDEEPEKV